jgi:hypothetical protein
MVFIGFVLCYLAGAGTVAWFGRASLLPQLLQATEPTKEGAASPKDQPPAPPPSTGAEKPDK